MNEVRAITIFVQAAVLGSLRRAAVDQGITPQAASRAVMLLEKELGVQLFHRSTRKLSLTEAGQRLFDSVRPALNLLSQAIAEVRQSGEEIAGPLHVSAPRALNRSVLWPHFLTFMRQYPDVRLEVQFDDRFTDLVGERADVGFRGGSQPAEGLIARRLVPIQLLVCAAPIYLERHGAPSDIEALTQHRCTGYRRANTGKQAPWEFRIGDEIVYRHIEATLCVNDIDAEVDAVLAGEAIGQLGSFSAVTHIRSGRLVPLLLKHAVQNEAIYLYYGRRTEQPLRVRTFVDFMVASIGGNLDYYLEPVELQARRALVKA